MKEITGVFLGKYSLFLESPRLLGGLCPGECEHSNNELISKKIIMYVLSESSPVVIGFQLGLASSRGFKIFYLREPIVHFLSACESCWESSCLPKNSSFGENTVRNCSS